MLYFSQAAYELALPEDDGLSEAMEKEGFDPDCPEERKAFLKMCDELHEQLSDY